MLKPGSSFPVAEAMGKAMRCHSSNVLANEGRPVRFSSVGRAIAIRRRLEPRNPPPCGES